MGFTKTKITEDNVPANVGLEQPNIPNQTASFWTKYNFASGQAKGLSLGLGVTHVGVRAGQRDSVVRSFGVPGYTVANGLIAYTRGENKFALNIENILDERYFTIVQARLANPGEHRSFRLTYTRSF